MPRYINADNFRKTMIKRFGCIPCLTDYSDTARYDIPIDDALELEPTADVAPRSEVAREIFAEIKREFCGANWYKGYTIERYIDELKKKYTEE